ncbi:MAG TPA: VWA domain-containing protein [Vicinamibacterales bacterium]|jgi:VWFA-related protein
MRHIFWSSLLAAAAAAVVVSAQQAPAPAPPDAQPPAVTFKVEVNYVEIDAIVRDAQGNFVRNLTKEDFQVTEDGHQQSLSIFTPVDIPIEHADPPLYAKASIPPDVVSNRTPFEGRMFVLVLDDVNTRFYRTQRARAAARLFVERYVGANDLVAVVNTGGNNKAMQDFTSNHQLLLAAIDHAMGSGTDSATSAQLKDYYNNRDVPGGGGNSTMNADFNELERMNQARNTLTTLRNVSEFLSGMRGRRKAVVWFSEGINYDISNPVKNRYASDILEAEKNVIAAATRSNVSIYGVDPRGLTSGMDDSIEIGSFADDNSIGPTNLQDELRDAQDSLRMLSDETGGFAAINKNDFRDAFARIQQDSSSYYVLGYYPTNEKRDGKFRNIQVRVNKPGVTVRARKGYVAPRGKAESAKATSGKDATSPDLRDALQSPVPISGLTLATFAAPFRGTAPNDAIAMAIEIDGSKLQFKQSPEGLFQSDLEISLFASDTSNNKIKDGARDVINLKLRPQTHAAVSKGTFRVVRRIQLPPGKYQLRVGVREAETGRLGTVLYDLDVPDFTKGPLAMSGIAITSAASSRVPTASPDPAVNEFKDVLPAPPTANREFARNDELAIFAEIYDNLGPAAHRIGITASILADDGKTVFTTSDERRSEELQGASGGYGYTTKIPLASLAPGRYVLRLEAKPMVGNSGPVKREVEFRIQ